ncbi:MAG: response regulator [Chloroflexales bacterium]
MAHILVVEDDTLIREMLETRFTHFGFNVTTAADGIQALLLGRSTRPDVIVMDMGLPKLNGWQATQRLRARQETATIPIIALTAYAMDDDRKRALHIGCDAFEPKPINFTSLLNTIHRLLAH